MAVPSKPAGGVPVQQSASGKRWCATCRPHRGAISGCGPCCLQEWRRAVADSLNGAILKHQGLPSVSPLERIFQQAALVLSELQQSNHPQVRD